MRRDSERYILQSKREGEGDPNHHQWPGRRAAFNDMIAKGHTSKQQPRSDLTSSLTSALHQKIVYKIKAKYSLNLYNTAQA
ncbi:hypothetical protein J6590_000441 [Homalodisca vitripennis]|nr:hypothetical protein J6590_000441 [Homalodisca vitripennis]